MHIKEECEDVTMECDEENSTDSINLTGYEVEKEEINAPLESSAEGLESTAEGLFPSIPITECAEDPLSVLVQLAEV